ncbi:MAG: ATP-binding protein [Candidatus Zhuqueibacterota bacterium]
MSESPKILVIDDDDVIRLACDMTLRHEGYVIETAENGRIGIGKLKAGPFDLVLLDLMMPEMSGTDVIDVLREIDPNIIIVVITGFATIESAVETLKKGVYDYIPKPFTPEELRNVVRKGLEKSHLLKEADGLRREREQNLLRIAAEQSRLTTIINCMGEGLIATDKDANLILVNQVACAMLHLTTPEKIGKHVSGFLNNSDLEEFICTSLSANNFPTGNISKEIVFDKEKDIIYLITGAPIKEKNDEVSGLALVLMDISEEKKLERMKAEFQKLVSVVAHELKAPINAIDGYLDLIIKGYVNDKPEKLLEYLSRSRQKAETLRNLVQDLLSITSIESGKFISERVPVDVKKVITEIITFMEHEAETREIQIILHADESIPPMNGDNNALTYLFNNLISNAIKYNRHKGSVTITLEADAARILVSVSDTGLGISEEDQRKIFTEFFRSRREEIQKIPGTGLGLNIAKRIAELHNGSIEVKSNIGEGSQFRVTLPLHR